MIFAILFAPIFAISIMLASSALNCSAVIEWFASGN